MAGTIKIATAETFFSTASDNDREHAEHVQYPGQDLLGVGPPKDQNDTLAIKVLSDALREIMFAAVHGPQRVTIADANDHNGGHFVRGGQCVVHPRKHRNPPLTVE